MQCDVNSGASEGSNGHRSRELQALSSAFRGAWHRITPYPVFPFATLIQESATAPGCRIMRDFLTTRHISINDLLQAAISDQVQAMFACLEPCDPITHHGRIGVFEHITQYETLTRKLGEMRLRG